MKLKYRMSFVVSTITAMNHYQLSSLFTSGVSIRMHNTLKLTLCLLNNHTGNISSAADFFCPLFATGRVCVYVYILLCARGTHFDAPSPERIHPSACRQYKVTLSIYNSCMYMTTHRLQLLQQDCVI